MTTAQGSPASSAVRHELLEATDEEIADAIGHANPMVLRGLLYQLTGDESLAEMELETRMYRGREGRVLANPEDAETIRAKATEFLIDYRDAGAGPIDIGPCDRLPRSLGLAVAADIPDDELEIWMEESALDPWARSLEWRESPSPERLEGFSVAVIGTGMGGLNAAVQLKRAGISHVVFEKNPGVGGTWFENRYPGARVDTPSHAYNHIYGAEFELPYPFCPQGHNERYFNWIADTFEVRDSIEFNSAVQSMSWDEDAKLWSIVVDQGGTRRERHFNAVISAVGLLAHPNVPQFPGMDDFEGRAFHTARWPNDIDVSGKRVAVIGSGCSGYQLFPEIAGKTERLYLFQRTPSWVFDVPNYLKPFAPQALWLKRNFPFFLNFFRLNVAWEFRPDAALRASTVDPDFEDPHAVSAYNKQIRDARIEFMRSKFGDRPDLMEKMLPTAPPGSSRPVLVDRSYSVYDVLLRDDVELVTEGIERFTPMGIETNDGEERELDIIVLATGFRASDFLLPMEVRGRGGMTIEERWAKDGPRAYLGVMLPGFPNFFMIYGPNTNPSSGLNLAAHHEIQGRFALKCIEELILTEQSSVDVTEDAYWRYNELLDRDEAVKIYRDPRADTYYVKEGRSPTNAAIDARLVWHWLREPSGRPRTLRPALAEKSAVIRPYFGEDLIVE